MRDAAGIIINSNNVAKIVDAGGLRVNSIGHIEAFEGTGAEQEAVRDAAGIIINSNNVAPVVDVASEGRHGTRVIDSGPFPFLISDEAMEGA